MLQTLCDDCVLDISCLTKISVITFCIVEKVNQEKKIEKRGKKISMSFAIISNQISMLIRSRL